MDIKLSRILKNVSKNISNKIEFNKFSKNKKAILFSLISLLFSALFVTIFTQNLWGTTDDRVISSNIRVKVMDTYVRNFEVYVGDSVKISSYKTLDAVLKYKDSTGKFFNNSDQFKGMFRDCMMCGSINCSVASPSCGLGGEDLTSKINNIVTLSKTQLNINTTYTISSINITQNYPFEVEVTINISYNVSDNSGVDNYARWNKTNVITEAVPIIGLIDPLGYINDSSNTYNRKIKRTYICSVGEACWDFNTTGVFYQESSFRYYHNGSSFLQRYWNDKNSSECCGIETILHPGEVGSIQLNNSYIDNYYWNGSYKCSVTNNIVSVTFGADSVHFDEIGATRYGLTNNAVLYCKP